MKKAASKPKRFIAVGCSHGHHCDENVIAQVCDFARRFKADRRIHLGDWCDVAAMRSGAAGTNDEAQSIVDDLKAGFKFLKEFQATDIFWANHEHRVIKNLRSPRAINAFAAQSFLGQFQDFARDLKAKVYLDYHIRKESSTLLLGDTLFLHGFMFNESATRDHVEWAGRHVVHAHTHRPCIQPGRVMQNYMGYCVGSLANIENMDYAGSNRSTSAWGAAVAYGEYNERETKVWLEVAKNGKFQFPI